MNRTTIGILLWIPALLFLISVARAFRYSRMPRSWRVPSMIGMGIILLVAGGVVTNVIAGSGKFEDLGEAAIIVFMGAVGLTEAISGWERKEERKWRDEWRREHDPQYGNMMDWVDQAKTRPSFHVIRWMGIPIVAAMMYWIISRS